MYITDKEQHKLGGVTFIARYVISSIRDESFCFTSTSCTDSPALQDSGLNSAELFVNFALPVQAQFFCWERCELLLNMCVCMYVMYVCMYVCMYSMSAKNVKLTRLTLTLDLATLVAQDYFALSGERRL